MFNSLDRISNRDFCCLTLNILEIENQVIFFLFLSISLLFLSIAHVTICILYDKREESMMATRFFV